MEIKFNWPAFWPEDFKKKAKAKFERMVDSALEEIYAEYDEYNFDPISEMDNELMKGKLVTLYEDKDEQ